MPGSPRNPAPPPAPVVSRTFEFPKYDGFIDAIRDGSIGGCILRREERPWRLERHLTGSALLQYGRNGAPSVAEVSVAPDRTGLSVLGPDSPTRYVDGREMCHETACVFRPGSTVAVASPKATTWLTLTASSEALGREASLLDGARDGQAPVPTLSLLSRPAEVSALRALLLEVKDTLGASPEGLHPEAAANLDRTLLRTLARFYFDASPGPGRARAFRVDRNAAFRSIYDFLRRVSSEPVYVEDLCHATGLPERTLRLLFEEQFGESPVRVLRSRRLCLTFEGLQKPGVGLKQIRRVAGSFGFWHMGQFAADYRALFGERPSDTVRRARLRTTAGRPGGRCARMTEGAGPLPAAL